MQRPMQRLLSGARNLARSRAFIFALLLAPFPET